MMKQFFGFVILLSSLTVFSQHPEFGKSKNGLIYSNSTIKQLKHVVDSLHTRLKNTGLNKTYASQPQACAHYVDLKNGDIQAARSDMDAGISFDSFAVKYKGAVLQKQLYVVKHAYTDRTEKKVVAFNSLDLTDHEHELYFDENVQQYNRPLKYTWVYMYRDSSYYGGASIRAFYFTEELQLSLIPDRYARMIQYVDYMVDTTATVFLTDAQVMNDWLGDYKVPDEITAFADYMDARCAPPENVRGQKQSVYEKNYRVWDRKRYTVFEQLYKKDSVFHSLFHKALRAGIDKGGTTGEFEDYVGRYISKDIELNMKRRRIVYGMCSRDLTPRNHALDITVLAAETNHWEVFLKSHLNILNDRFDRMSDGNYAYAGRHTYVKELEMINVDVRDLLLGMSLRIGNPCNNHYYGSIERAGRALYESKDAEYAEALMLTMICDRELDMYNRVNMYYLFLNYIEYATGEKKKKNMDKLQQAVLSLPASLAVQWSANK